MRRLVPGPAADAALSGARMAPRPGVLAVGACALLAVPADCTVTVPTLACPLEVPGAAGPVLPAQRCGQLAVRYLRLPDPGSGPTRRQAALSCTPGPSRVEPAAGFWCRKYSISRLAESREVRGDCGGQSRPVWRLFAGRLVLAGVTGCSSERARTASLAGHAAACSFSAPASGTPQAQARQAYLGMWQAFVAASRTADYQSGALAHYAAGGALSVLTHGLYQNYRNGIVTRGPAVLHPAVTVADGSAGSTVQADVTDCADSSHWLDYYGREAGRRPARRDAAAIIARLQPFNGSWKVTYLIVGKEGTC